MSEKIPSAHPWLLCIHNIPPKPSYLRTKAARRLATLGAVPLKNAVYLLPDGEQQREALLWLTREIEEGGGRAFVCGAGFDLGGNFMTDAQVKTLFIEAREAQYRALLVEAQPVFETLKSPHEADEQHRQEVAAWLAQLRAQFEAVVALDFFGASGREAVEGVLAGTERWLRLATNGELLPAQNEEALNLQQYQKRTWVTRPGVHVDRIATAWFIRRYIDAAAYIRCDGVVKTPSDVRFDMAEAEFTHEGEECTFEVMVRRFGFASDKALAAMCAVIHDIDLDEARPTRPESPGIAALMLGITLHTDNDEERLEQGFRILDTLLEYYKRGATARP